MVTFVQQFKQVDLNQLAVGAIAGLVAGAAIGGIGARLAMRGVALAAGLEPGFTLGGTMIIFVLGAIMGMVFGLPYGWLWRLLPLPGRVTGLLYGLTLNLVFVLPLFFNQRNGEFGLVTPLVGFSLFGPIPIFYGLGLQWLSGRVEKHFTTVHQISVAWFGALLLAFFLFLAAIGTLFSATLPLPSLVSKAYRQAGLSFTEAREAHAMVTMLFTTLYCLLLVTILWRNRHRPAGQWAVLVLLLFGAAFFQSGSGRVIPMLSRVDIWPKLLQFVGFVGLFLLLTTWPDGRFRPGWLRPVGWGWVGLLALLLGVNGLPAAGQIAIVLITLLLACAGQWLRASSLLPGLLLTIFVLVITWLVILGVEGAMVGRPHDFTFLFNFAPYLFPWLLIPLTLLRNSKVPATLQMAGT